MIQKTYMAKSSEVEKKCYIIDADNKILGRIATKAASILRGKHKPTFTPHVDTGDMVIIINAEKVKVTGNKLKLKEYQRYSGYHSGQKSITLEELLKKSPTQVIKLAVNRMIPSGALGSQVKTKLKVYKGDSHPHQAQKPITLEI
ncbi:MAG: 50S ribosomal protein L13 [Omnitrophica WOR_2 bacterium GWF2_38_59]|nr:MAG: 50S ribosomal protein L13 [Omnitrophica WOR_2 bacterium GWA2_37_7]OGX26495.1 MAG: 50S ribosomal protein L13 [Omnitrophica WOR_2 bacterium GWF2_38_59]OGX49309.1 MAG: 50S ribosomal protein L13 [Omnitrophica WOR_2 bacterium RIFOXYA2_FULL_38_17]OGX51476.1 MAG: 50S ribosomal protein L13 [Omnitrophica WOR_2 bacterium RIFOXYA12_FULL_38_10]OGX55892.1 MAG: 50S ribosomal protein L13 [Omnitrophica WOR_2 bacterium RIFOXYC2_FULL_38_12]OGX58233.1 MAG: 50S ribosomal protein L13 [Omnitrophica WOR_2 ba